MITPMRPPAMSGADEAAAKLRTQAMAMHSGLARAINAYRLASLKLSGLGEADDLVEALRCAAMLTLAAEDVKDAAEAVEKAGRAALVETAETTGCPSFATTSHVVSFGESARSAIITDAALIPADLKTAPVEPKPDMTAIAKALRAGREVRGAVLRNAGTKFVSFHPIGTRA